MHPTLVLPPGFLIKSSANARGFTRTDCGWCGWIDDHVGKGRRKREARLSTGVRTAMAGVGRSGAGPEDDDAEVGPCLLCASISLSSRGDRSLADDVVSGLLGG